MAMGTGDDVKPKTVIFESGILSEPIDGNHAFHHVTVSTGALDLTEGQAYAIVLDASPTTKCLGIHLGWQPPRHKSQGIGWC
jgi:hypothetical protein